ncbi:ClC family H(+)/Cl(-) exchange transporter [Clostridium sp. WILCCON 0269]|uniref:ClC family H(+)/Cl(-) exchange transporter n=1 Tax=Candidatus Clostridium eludens TaxID=3381663 RepID=A0ABW8SLV8_9CLOT
MKDIDKGCKRNSQFKLCDLKLKLVLEGIIIGILTGFIIVLFRLAIEKLGNEVIKIYKIFLLRLWLLPLWVVFLIGIGYILGIMIKKEPMISGSGIPQVEGVILKKLEMTWYRVILGKLIGGITAIGLGFSLGREGPSVQLGAAVGQGISKLLKRTKVEEKYLITSGASAGLAAAFNAPLAGTIFSLEEVHKNFSPMVLVSAISSALSADFITSQFFGLKPVFNFSYIHPIPLKYYLYIVIFGIIIGFGGVLFNIMLLKTQKLYSKQKFIPKEFNPAIPLLISVILGLFLPEILGGGNNLIMALTLKHFSLILIFIFLILKFVFTMICYGSGAPGGIFLPLLTIGALIGYDYGSLFISILHLDSFYMNNFIIMGMAGYFTAVVKSPITGIVLITEMTGSFNHLLSISIVAIIAYLVADKLGSKPIYESLLKNYLKGHPNKIKQPIK